MKHPSGTFCAAKVRETLPLESDGWLFAAAGVLESVMQYKTSPVSGTSRVLRLALLKGAIWVLSATVPEINTPEIVRDVADGTPPLLFVPEFVLDLLLHLIPITTIVTDNASNPMNHTYLFNFLILI
jgi:hypothetical protein